MKKLILLLALTGGFAVGQVGLSVAGLQVVKKGYQSEGDKDDKFGQSELRAFNWHAGTRVALMLVSEGKAIVSLDEDASKITTFTDDQGTDFSKSKARFGRDGVKFGFASYSDDKKALVVDVESGGVPKQGAGELILKGEVVVSVASESKLEKSEAVAATKGTKLKVGEREFEVTTAGKPKWGDDEFSIELKSKYNDRDFKAVKFYAADGTELKANRSMSSSGGVFGKSTHKVTFNFEKKFDKFSLGLDAWTDLEKVKVPFDLKVKAGL